MSEPAAQGEIWTVRTVSGQEFSVVVTDSDTITRLRPVVLCARVRPAREVPSALELLTVKLPEDEVVAVHEMTAFPKTHFVALRGRLTDSLIEELKVALRARFDL